MPEYDPQKFEEMVLFVAWRKRDDPRFGRLKLAKTLFYADFTSYAERGEAMTWAAYEHWPYGPFPPVLYDVEKSLVSRGMAVQTKPQFVGEEAKLVPLDEPAYQSLSDAWERAFVGISADKVGEEPATWRVSDRSHEHPGWLRTHERQVIPYYSVYMSAKGPSEDDLAHAEVITSEW